MFNPTLSIAAHGTIPNAYGGMVGAIPSSTRLATVIIKLEQGTYSAIFKGKVASKIVVGGDVEARVDGG
jgi:hypothetical protein